MDLQRVWFGLGGARDRFSTYEMPALLIVLLVGLFIAWRYFDKDMAALRRRGQFRAPKNIQFAFASILVWVGLMSAAMSVFSLMTGEFSLNLSGPFETVRDAYRSIFHNAFDFAVSWLALILPELRVPIAVKDIATIYLLIGGSLARAFAAGANLRINQRSKLISGTGLTVMMVIRFFEQLRSVPFRPQIFGLLVVTAWPLFLIDLMRGVMLVVKKSENFDGPSDYYYILVSRKTAGRYERWGDLTRVVYEVPKVLFLQMMALTALVLFMVAVNFNLGYLATLMALDRLGPPIEASSSSAIRNMEREF